MPGGIGIRCPQVRKTVAMHSIIKMAYHEHTVKFLVTQLRSLAKSLNRLSISLQESQGFKNLF